MRVRRGSENARPRARNGHTPSPEFKGNPCPNVFIGGRRNDFKVTEDDALGTTISAAVVPDIIDIAIKTSDIKNARDLNMYVYTIHIINGLRATYTVKAVSIIRDHKLFNSDRIYKLSLFIPLSTYLYSGVDRRDLWTCAAGNEIF